jgi:hypothetical protein
MTKLNVWIAAAVMMLTSATLAADRLRLRSGKIVDGTFVAADSKTVRILLANGELAQVPMGDIAGASGEEHLKVPVETRLQFQLQAAIDVRR